MISKLLNSLITENDFDSNINKNRWYIDMIDALIESFFNLT